MGGERMYIMSTSRMTSGEESNQRNGSVDLAMQAANGGAAMASSNLN